MLHKEIIIIQSVNILQKIIYILNNYNALTNKRCNIPNSSFYFWGLEIPFQRELNFGYKFIRGKFISISKNLNMALFYWGKTLFVVKIENNKNVPSFITMI
jgi:hypothetical protein